MHIAFSALGQQPTSQSSGVNNTPLDESEVLLRFKAYEATCEKYKDEILAIQKYIPGWMPAFSR